MPLHFVHKFNKIFTKPVSRDPDDQRREYIFNVLIAFFTLAAFATTLSSGLNHLMHTNAHSADSVPITIGFLLVTVGLWRLSRKGYYKVGAYALVVLVLLASLQLALAWSIELPMAQLLSVVVIILAGITISSRASLWVTVLVSAATLVLGYLQTHGVGLTDTSWLTKKLEFSDAIGLVVIYAITGAISWLSNKEIDSLLRRAWRSEAALAKERDMLEVTVANRTQELERVQLERTLQLQYLAEYGQISASLVHDLATPLTSATLSLEQIGDKSRNSAINEVEVSINHIQEYIASVRNQIQGRSTSTRFSVGDEITSVITLLKQQAQFKQITLQYTGVDNDIVKGDKAAFRRVIANLVINAIQAYQPAATGSRIVRIKVVRRSNVVAVTITDFGSGIKPKDLTRIFEDFYSSKQNIGRGLGIGLSSSRRTIEESFKGTISAASSVESGTQFTIEIPYDKSTRHQTKHTTSTNLPGIKTT